MDDLTINQLKAFRIRNIKYKDLSFQATSKVTPKVKDYSIIYLRANHQISDSCKYISMYEIRNYIMFAVLCTSN